jgi:lipoate-protein ligase A
MHIIFSPFTEPSFNLAAEEFLFSTKTSDFVFLYINEPSVVIGSNQAVENEVDIDFCTEKNIRIFRRLSGGGAVFHDRGNLNYCLIHKKTEAPLSADFLTPIVHALKSLNIPVKIGERKDLWLNGNKISGTASHVSKNRELHHGTLLYDADLEMLQSALNPQKRDIVRKATASVPSSVCNLRAFIEQKVDIEYDSAAFFGDFTQLLLNYYGIRGLSVFLEEEMVEIAVLQRKKYLEEEWNYRM